MSGAGPRQSPKLTRRSSAKYMSLILPLSTNAFGHVRFEAQYSNDSRMRWLNTGDDYNVL